MAQINSSSNFPQNNINIAHNPNQNNLSIQGNLNKKSNDNLKISPNQNNFSNMPGSTNPNSISNMNNLNNINQIMNFNNLNYGRMMNEKNKEEYLKLSVNSNNMGNNNMKINPKRSDSFETLFKLNNDEITPLEIAKATKSKLEKSRSINDFNNDFIRNENPIFQTSNSEKPENLENKIEKIRLAKFLQANKTISMRDSRNENNLEVSTPYQYLPSYNNFNEEAKGKLYDDFIQI
jgi:hypothetical protein